MSNKKQKLAIAVGTAFLATSIAPIASADANPFTANSLDTGYNQVNHAHHGEEGKCGEGKCGEGKCGEGKCGEGKCGEGKCGEGKGAHTHGEGEGKTDSEGKCGEGKCGGNS